MKTLKLTLRILLIAIILVIFTLDLLSLWITTLNCIAVVILNIFVIIMLIISLYLKQKSYRVISYSYKLMNDSLTEKERQIQICDEKLKEYKSIIDAQNEQISSLYNKVRLLETRNNELLNENKELKDSLDNAIEKKYRCVLEYLSNTWHDADTFDEKDKIFTKKQVERLLKSLNYRFVDYNDETQSYYQIEYSDENEVIVTKRAIENISTHQVAIKGIAYIPHS